MARIPRNLSKAQLKTNASQDVGLILPVSRPHSTTEKTDLHPRNKHRGRYDFIQLIAANPALENFVRLNAYHDASIDFANPEAVKALNQALLAILLHIRLGYPSAISLPTYSWSS